MVTRFCLNCNKQFEIKDSGRRPLHRKFCSIFCKGKYYRINNKEHIEKIQNEWRLKNRERDLEYHRIWERKDLSQKK